MNRKRFSVIAAMVFLIQAMIFPRELFPETFHLNPPIRAGINESRLSFRAVYNVLSLALLVYKLDTVENYSKERMLSEYGRDLSGPDIKLDINKIDVGRDGRTRYYPFYAGKKCFVARIFPSRKKFYQPKMEVLYEASISNPAVTIQILPDLNTILKDCRVEPRSAFHDARTASSL